MGVIHLVRHGRASWDSDDYDELCDEGHRQSAALGSSWEASGFEWSLAVSGSMRRHTETAIDAIEARGYGDGYEIDERWNEYDHLALTGMVDVPDRPRDPKEFQRLLNAALHRWSQGGQSAGESFAGFRTRVLGAFGAVAEQAGPGRSAVVFSSGGPIALLASELLSGDSTLFPKLNDVLVNASVTTVIIGQTGPRLLTFNEHTHLPRDLVTYR